MWVGMCLCKPMLPVIDASLAASRQLGSFNKLAWSRRQTRNGVWREGGGQAKWVALTQVTCCQWRGCMINKTSSRAGAITDLSLGTLRHPTRQCTTMGLSWYGVSQA
jgi:hypothetical protein